MNEKSEPTNESEIVDLGDAMVETKQEYPLHNLPDSAYIWGAYGDG